MTSGEAMQSLWPWLHEYALSAAGHAPPARSSNVWTIAAVVVAAVGSAIVAWQALETHRTTSLSQKALDASAALAIDSARSRLDQGAPRIDVYVEGVSILTAGPQNMVGAQIEPGARWDLGQDSARSLQVQARVRVKNLMSDRTTHLKVTGLHDPDMHADTEVLLLPTTERFYFLTAKFTLGQWAENWASHQAGMPAPHVVNGCVISGDDRDEGVVDRWPLCLAAWPIQPTGDSDGAWRLTEGKDWSDIAMRPLRERSYWISQRRGVPLPDLPERQAPTVRRAGKARALCPPDLLAPRHHGWIAPAGMIEAVRWQPCGDRPGVMRRGTRIRRWS
jgi:hypothetical protein